MSTYSTASSSACTACRVGTFTHRGKDQHASEPMCVTTLFIGLLLWVGPTAPAWMSDSLFVECAMNTKLVIGEPVRAKVPKGLLGFRVWGYNSREHFI
eukprot:7292491-Pyramimonas_sp.AAC.1